MADNLFADQPHDIVKLRHFNPAHSYNSVPSKVWWHTGSQRQCDIVTWVTHWLRSRPYETLQAQLRNGQRIVIRAKRNPSQ